MPQPSKTCFGEVRYVRASGPELAYSRLVVKEGLTYGDAAAKMGIHEETAVRYRQRVRRYVESLLKRRTNYAFAALYLLEKQP